MNSSYKFLFTLLFLGISSYSWGQAVTPPPGNSLKPSNNTNRSQSDSINSALRIRDEHKMYQVSVWRRIDLRERYNLPFAGSGVAKLDGIVNNIYKAAASLDSILKPYKDENLTIPLDVKEFEKAFWETSDVASDDPNDTTMLKITGPADIYFIDFKEDFVFDRQHSQIKFDIKYISLVMDKEVNMPKRAFKDSTAVLSEKVVAYFRYDDFINFFKKHPTARWINFENISESKTYPQAFARRDFRSVITKFTNEKDFTILSLVDKKITDPEKRKFQAYLDALAYEYKLLDFENSLWEW